MANLTIDEMSVFCKKKGFVYPNSEIYGGMAGFFDYGPLGAELKNNIKNSWWKYHVHDRDDVVGIDGTIITHPKVWEASGHVANFEDLMLECSKCGEKFKAESFIEEKTGMPADGMKASEINKIIEEKRLACPKCKSHFKEVEEFNLMFKTNVGPKTDKESIAYLRPETAQLIFADFKQVTDTSRLKLPFGIAQMGRAFRNEIAPRNFLFRLREFEQMELEYFVHPKDTNHCPYIKDILSHEILVLSAEMQKKEEKDGKVMSMKKALDDKIIKTQWHAYWLAMEHLWFTALGAKRDNFRIRQHIDTEKSHYALDTWDLEYKFPFGWKELQGMANRTDFDLKQHMKFSKKDLSLFVDGEKERVVPYVVAEPSQGVDRAFLVFMFDAYNYDEKRGNVVLKLHPKLAPYKAAIFPLLSNKDELKEKAKDVYNKLKKEFNVFYDEAGSIGKRYARQDEISTPYCITIDFDSLKNDDCTIRNRDTTEQKRVKIRELREILRRLVCEEISFKNI